MDHMNPTEPLNTGASACRVSRACCFPHALIQIPASLNFLAEAKHCPSNMSAAAPRVRGHWCILEETRERNTVGLAVNGVIVFTCHIKQLQFGGDGKLDPVCKEAVTAVENAH